MWTRVSASQSSPCKGGKFFFFLSSGCAGRSAGRASRTPPSQTELWNGKRISLLYSATTVMHSLLFTFTLLFPQFIVDRVFLQTCTLVVHVLSTALQHQMSKGAIFDGFLTFTHLNIRRINFYDNTGCRTFEELSNEHKMSSVRQRLLKLLQV